MPPDEERVEKLGNLPPVPASMRLPRSEPAPPREEDADAAKEPASSREAEAVADVQPGVPGVPPVPVGATTGRVITSADPRLEIVETALATGDWRKVASDLGPLDKAGGLPPTLGLVCAVAHREIAGEDAAQEANDLAIRSAAAIFGVPLESKLAMVLAKRLMRKNPVAWQKRPAPKATTSVLIVMATLLVGGGLGWLFSSGIVHFTIR